MATFDWKLPLAALVAAFPLWSTAAPVQVVARAGISLDPLAIGCRDGFQAKVSTASASCAADGTETATGSPYELSATMRADASDLGHLRLSGSAHTLGRTNMPAQTQSGGTSSIDIQDFHHFSAAGLDGQVGTVTATLLVTGDLFAWADAMPQMRAWAESRWNLDIGTSGDSMLNLQSRHTYLRSDWVVDQCSVDFVSADCAETLGLFSFDIPFVWGQDLPFWFRVSGFATATSLDSGRAADAAFDFGHSFVWGGLSNLRVGNTQVTAYDYHSGTGYDWRVSRIAAGPSNVPEPATTGLMVLALGGAWCARRRGKA